MQTYEELQQERDALLLRVRQLSDENKSLREQLALLLPHTTTHSNPKQSNLSLAEKVQLFQSIFKGRTDVFARRWYSKSTNKSGYQPVCKNEWNITLCDKKKTKCTDCLNRQFACLDYDAVYQHLEGKDEYGRDVIGVYPIFEDNTCYFLCADFDDKNSQYGYQSDVQTFVSVSHDWGLEPAIERSRSGNGAHVWLFFQEPTSAIQARKLGFAILTEATNRNGQISFKSYDRFFPNQDTLPQGGLGNLVALPLQGQARKQGNSLFVNDEFEAYPDQWQYLQQLKKISPNQIEQILQKHSAKDLGELSTSTEERPWELPKSSPVTTTDFPSKLTIIKSNELYIPTQGLSAKVINHFKRIASFKNPEFYAKQAMRFSTFSTPRIICCAELNDKYIALPRGCENAVIQLLKENLINYTIDEQTSRGNEIQVTFLGELRKEQHRALYQLLPHTNGVLSANTAFGKTVTAAALIAEKKVNTLVLVHTKALLEQWKQTLSKFLEIQYQIPNTPTRRGRKKLFSPVGTLDSTGNHLSNIIDIALIQSCISNDEVKEFIRNYGMVIMDECHHVSALQFERVLQFVNAQHVYGLTATPIRKDGHQPIIFMQCGPIRYTAQNYKPTFTRELRPRFTSFKNLSNDSLAHNSQLKALAENEARNHMIVKDVCDALNNNRTPIILTQLTNHVHILAELLKLHCPNVVSLIGTESAKQKRLAMERLHAIPQAEQLVIIATGKYVGEGFDFPRLDAMFLALPISWKGLVAQYTGRLHREYEGKNSVIVYDYIDIHIPLCEKMYRKRLRGYSANAYQIIPSVDNTTPSADIPTENTIFNGMDFSTTFIQDLHNAKHSILVMTSSIQSDKAQDTLACLLEKQRKGCIVQVFTKDIIQEAIVTQLHLFNSSPLDELSVTIHESVYFQCTIIDRHTIWYGDINFFATNTKHHFSMRLTDSTIAEQIINLIV